ncbi:FAD-dependent oxidoreductase [Ramlibacter humi]|uniref:FAD-dependent oxidoreductase n=1 Tax=Ramlibacter humi TaxID=2530451 RepID=A0A4Z0CBN3_9BURK|nr:FAD-dependent oxidoreductase [Ramlibacter humi]TFZ08424.1 FAD-dependent oxidoreductase [Ramlibacter humi]
MAEPARQVSLEGCSLPAAWAGQAQWRILQTGFGPGLDFLAAWQAWRDDPRRPRLLHFVGVEASSVSADELLRAARATAPELEPLARELAAQWWGLVPGFHRLSFDDGRVLLTLCVGEAQAVLQELAFEADSVILGTWEPGTAKAMARCCQRGAGIVAPSKAEPELRQNGFQLEQGPAGVLRGTFDPAWKPSRRRSRVRSESVRGNPVMTAPTRAVVVGGGIAGSAAAASLARRGWHVQVIDAAPEPASGASALPAGLLAPHTSPDDNLLSRLSRAGVRMTLAEAAARLVDGNDFARTGSLEKRLDDNRPLPALGPGEEDWQRWQDDSHTSVWHEAAAWVKPASLVRAWLATPGIEWRGGTAVSRVQREGDCWRVVGANDEVLAEADLVVLAAALGTKVLSPHLPLNPVRGQVSWGVADGDPPAPTPLNGNGHFLPAVPLREGQAWLTGSTYGRGDSGTDERPEDHAANLARLQQLAPEAASALASAFERGRVRAWAGVRCASSDRRPLVGALGEGLWVSTALGSRGLTFALLCAELLAARLHGEPLPLPARLAAALDAARVRPG